MRWVALSVLALAACTGESTTGPIELTDASADARDVPGYVTFIAASGELGVTNSYIAEVYVRSSDESEQYQPTDGTMTVEERVCVPGPKGDRCRWQVYTVPESSTGSLAGQTLRNLRTNTVILLDVPGTTLRVSYKHQGEKNAENVECPLQPIPSVYFCFSDE